ncbi:MAG: DUF2142 domain-containing protein [Oscillospiraceae bacterium]|nr:DUF2142 domain-containing protein [Oscillospiraceae bacterium]MBQ8612563.1 DUF2142 domain-containing protein [Oscillospiraceae bacterium]
MKRHKSNEANGNGQDTGRQKKYRHLLVIAVLLLAAAAAFVFVGIDTLSLAQGKTQRVIVNDDYSVLTQPVQGTEGIRQQLQIKAGTTLHGVSVNISTFARVVRGTVYADVLDAQGKRLAGAAVDMVQLKDNTFRMFLLDHPVTCAQDTELVLHIYTEPQTAEDVIALWKSETDYEGFALSEADGQSTGTIAVQYIVEHVGQDVVWYYVLLFVLSAVALVLVYVLAFVIKVKPEWLFLAAALLVGMVFVVFTPVGGAPDEYVHIASAYKMSNRILGVEELGGYGTVTVRACDAQESMAGPVNYDSFSFQEIWQGLSGGAPADKTLTVIEARTADVFFLQYLAQALGVSLARLLGVGYIWLIVFGRMANLLAYAAVTFLAIRCIPVFRTALALCALLPMSLQLAGSFSYDAYVLYLSFLGIAMVFSMAYGDGKVGWKELLGCTAVFSLLAPAKAVYILLAFLVFIVPSGRLGGRKKALLAKGAVVLIAVLFWLLTNAGMVLNTLGITYTHVEAKPEIAAGQVLQEAEPEQVAEGVQYPFDAMESTADDAYLYYDPESDILPNGDSRYYYSVSYMLRNPGQTLRLLVHTLTQETGKYVQSLLGTRLGELILVDLSASWLWGIALLVLLVLSVMPVQTQEPVHTGLRRLWGVAVFAGVAAATVLACIMWTPVNYAVVFGVQGRYLLPAFPLLVMALQNRMFRLTRNVDHALIFSVVPVNLLILLNVFLLMVQQG